MCEQEYLGNSRYQEDQGLASILEWLPKPSRSNFSLKAELKHISREALGDDS